MEAAINKPEAPHPESFGIDGQYYELAVEGARIWARHRSLPRWLKWLILLGFFFLPGIICLFYVSDPKSAIGVMLVTAIVTLGVGQGVIATIEDIRGAKLKRNIYDPTYNPNPEGYQKYAAAFVEYEKELSQVYLSDNWIYHSVSYCCGMRYGSAMQKWQATARNATPCSNCGHLLRINRRRELPRPFGRALLSKELHEFEQDLRERGERRLEAQRRMDENTARIIARIQREQDLEMKLPQKNTK